MEVKTVVLGLLIPFIDASGGAVFFAAGVFYYFRRSDVKELFCAMAERFPGAVLAFDSCNERGAKLMRQSGKDEDSKDHL